MTSPGVLPPARRMPLRWVDLERPHVEQRFGSAERRVCVVLAAAGWGKTTAVASWARRHRTVWVSGGARPGAARIVAALRDAVAADGGGVPEPMPGAHGDPAETADAVGEWLRGALRSRLVLVVDDVQRLVPGSADIRLLEGLATSGPDLLHLVLVSRRELPFSLARLGGQGLLDEIDASMLAFDRAEIEVLLHETVPRHVPALADALWARTGGWPAAVRAGIEALWQAGDAAPDDVLDRLVLPGQRFHAYLAEEVVAPEPPPVQDCLRRVAVFGEVADPASAEPAVPDPASALADLTRRGFLYHLPGDVPRWELLPPLAGWFRHTAVLPSNERSELHAAAAAEHRARGDYGQALRHLVAAGDREGVTALLAEHGADLVAGGGADDVLRAAGWLSEGRDDARLLQTLGDAQQIRGCLAAALESYRRAAGEAEELPAALGWRIAWLLRMQGEFDNIPGVLERVVPGTGDTIDEVLLLVQAAVAHRMLGDLGTAAQFASRAVGTARRCGDPSMTAPVHSVLAMLAAAAGDHRRADVHFTIAVDAAAAEPNPLQTVWVRLCRAVHLLELGAPRAAAADVRALRALPAAHEVPVFAAHLAAVAGGAQLHLGDLDAATAEFTRAVDLFQRVGSRLLAWPLSGLGDVYRARGQLARARAAYEEALTTSAAAPDSIGLSHALMGLARVRAADDLAVARDLADRAVSLSEGLHMVAALLTHGWVALLGGDRSVAALDAVGAATAARHRRDDLGLAEAVTLGVLASEDPAAQADRLGEAIQIWHEAGCGLDEAVTRVVAGVLGGPRSRLEADRAVRALRAAGVDVESRTAAGPLAGLRRAAPPVSIRAMGVFQVVRDGEPVPKAAWQSKKARDLLKILVARRRPAPRDLLAELLWPDADPARSTGRLSVLLSTLRDVLQSDRGRPCPLRCEGTAVWLDRSLVRIDVEDFLDQADAALKAWRGGEPDARDQLTAALAAYAGDFLADEPYEDWATQLGEDVRARHLALLRALVAALRDDGDVDQVTGYGLQLLEQDPYDEEIRLDLVTALLEAGRLGEARRHYEAYVRRMREIDVEPRPMPRPRRAPSENSSLPASPAPHQRDRR